MEPYATKNIKKPKFWSLLFHSNVAALSGNRQIRRIGEIVSRLRRRVPRFSLRSGRQRRVVSPRRFEKILR